MSPNTPEKRSSSVWMPLLLGACAGGLGWGIRGQYGHETGAMIAGLLVSLVIAMFLGEGLGSRQLIRAVAWGTLAIGFGGSMTYAQTIGLTQDAALIGNTAAMRWGFLGLAVKGGIWISFCGVFLGMGLGGVRYRARDILVLMCVMVGLYFVGVRLLNSPFDPANKILPAIYFSASWEWLPGGTLKPRPECWGGLLLALAAVFAVSWGVRRDGLALRLGAFGFLGGALGFPLGQTLQSFHAWNPGLYKQGIFQTLDPHMNWWNMMETTFGAVMGATLGLGAALCRHRIQPVSPSEKDDESIPRVLETVLLIGYTIVLLLAEFGSMGWIRSVFDLGLILALVPMVATTCGRWWPWFLTLPITLLPITVKTVHQLVNEEHTLSAAVGWLVYCALPLSGATFLACWLAKSALHPHTQNKSPQRWPAVALIAMTWIYFGLNFAFFHFPWPWSAWTYRTPNGILFTLSAAVLTLASWRRLRTQPPGCARMPPNQ